MYASIGPVHLLQINLESPTPTVSEVAVLPASIGAVSERSAMSTPPPGLALSLLPTNGDQTLPRAGDGAYLATLGRSFTLNAVVSASGTANITDPVQIVLTVPRGLAPRGMTIASEDAPTLAELISDADLPAKGRQQLR
jgi:hypothetical protein